MSLPSGSPRRWTPAQNTITRNELTVYGSYVGVNTFPRAIQVLERGVIRPSILISHRLPLKEIEQGMEVMRAGQAMKVMIDHTL